MIEQSDNNLSTKSDMPAEEFSGKRLKQKRESMNITQEEVAERLHLDIEVIKALENDNFAALPGRTYTKGYQRSYATLLGIPVKENSPVIPDVENSSQLLPENLNYRNETKTRKFTYVWVSALLLIVLLIFSESIQINDENSGLKDPGVNKETVTKAVTVPQENKTVVNTSETSTLPADAAVGTTPPVKTAADITKENGVTKFNGLVLKYEKSAWTEVYDANGKKLVLGTIKAGETIQVQGVQPFSVLFGNANAVKVEFGGKAFSTKKYIRNGMAQFVIGSSFNNKK